MQRALVVPQRRGDAAEVPFGDSHVLRGLGEPIGIADLLVGGQRLGIGTNGGLVSAPVVQGNADVISLQARVEQFAARLMKARQCVELRFRPPQQHLAVATRCLGGRPGIRRRRKFNPGGRLQGLAACQSVPIAAGLEKRRGALRPLLTLAPLLQVLVQHGSDRVREFRPQRQFRHGRQAVERPFVFLACQSIEIGRRASRRTGASRRYQLRFGVRQVRAGDGADDGTAGVADGRGLRIERLHVDPGPAAGMGLYMSDQSRGPVRAGADQESLHTTAPNGIVGSDRGAASGRHLNGDIGSRLGGLEQHGSARRQRQGRTDGARGVEIEVPVPQPWRMGQPATRGCWYRRARLNPRAQPEQPQQQRGGNSADHSASGAFCGYTT